MEHCDYSALFFNFCKNAHIDQPDLKQLTAHKHAIILHKERNGTLVLLRGDTHKQKDHGGCKDEGVGCLDVNHLQK